MSLITTSLISKSFGPNDIFEEISLSIPRNARIAIVGPNGVGKTTLLRILVGLDFPDEGSVSKAKGLTIGYLPQEATLVSDGTLWSQCLKVFSDLLEMKSELDSHMDAMSDPELTADAVSRYGNLEETFDTRGGYTYEIKIKQTLSGLGFSEIDYHRPITQLSGGQRTRALLAKLLLESPDVMMLDEPSNHLDIQAVEWLESFFKDWQGALVVVSHDRYFLDQVSDRIWEMTPSLEVYRGNYSAYMKQREERYTRRLAEYKTQTAFIEKEQAYIQRNIAGQNTNQAKGRQRRLTRLLKETRLAPPPAEPRRMHLDLITRGRSGDLVLRTHQLQVGYHDEGKPLFDCPDLLLQRGECAAIIGPNGAGKTTFLKTILEKTPPFTGTVQLGASLTVGYFAQAHEELDPGRTLMGEIDSIRSNMLPAEKRNYLARYLFTGEEVFRKVNTLSGGERGRLALAKLGLSDANLLLLDEPTNHLDLHTQEVLESVLSTFPGTILLASHDRYLIDSLATQIWDVDPDGRSLRVFAGSYTAYKEHLAERLEIQSAEKERKKQATKTITTTIKSSDQEKILTSYQRRQLIKRMSVIEGEIKGMESKQADLARILQDPPEDSTKIRQAGEDFVTLQEKIDALLGEWAEIEEILGQ